MGFNFKRWLLEKLDSPEQRTTAEDITATEMFSLGMELYARELSFFSCVNLIANAISKCEFKTFVNGEEIRGAEYYLWNVSPSVNQSSSRFLHKLITQLYSKNQALVIEQGGCLLVADGFSRKEYALYEDVFSQVTVGDFTFSQSFTQSQVLFFTLHERNMRPILNGMYEAYQKLLAHGMKSYQKSRGTKAILEVDTLAAGTANFEERFSELVNSGNFKTFANAENAMLPLFKGLKFTDLGNKTYAQEGTRDIRAMIDDVSDFAAKAFGIPPVLLRGDVQGVADAMGQFLTFCIDPLVDSLAEEINRKRIGEAHYLRGTYLKIDTRCIKHIDLLSVSTAIDKLISSGAFCVNEIRGLVGQEAIDEPWAGQHFMTKNYASVADLLALENSQTPSRG